MAFINDKSTKPWKTIDPDTNITLINKGKLDGDEPEIFELTIDGQTARIEMRTIAKVRDKKFDVIYEVQRLYLPDSLNGQEDKIKKILENALKAHGLTYTPEKVNFVSVNFLPKI